MCRLPLAPSLASPARSLDLPSLAPPARYLHAVTEPFPSLLFSASPPHQVLQALRGRPLPASFSLQNPCLQQQLFMAVPASKMLADRQRLQSPLLLKNHPRTMHTPLPSIHSTTYFLISLSSFGGKGRKGQKSHMFLPRASEIMQLLS